MPTPDHIKLVVRGTLPGNEEWTCSLAFGVQDGPYALLDLQDFVDESFEAWKASHTRFPWLADSVSMQQCLAYVYDGGNLVEQAVSTGAPLTGSASARLPNQIATVATLQTAVPGRRTRGRIYLPVLLWTIGSNGRIGLDDAQGLATTVSAMLEEINAGLPLSLREVLRPAVVSQVGEGRREALTSVRVGTVLDTQRRRRNGLTESYASSSLDYAG